MSNFLRKIIFHPNPPKRTIITLIYCSTGVFFNFFMFQVFCVPVFYASVMCILFFAAFTIFPFVKKSFYKTLLYILLGTGVPICVYLIFFLGGPLFYIYYSIAILFFGLGLMAYIPVYLLLHLLLYFRKAPKSGKWCFRFGVCIPLVALGIYLLNFKVYLSMSNQILKTSFDKNQFISRLPNSYFTERILGLHWKYHTCVDYDDGWRPPLHDPFLVIGLNLFSKISFERRNHIDLWPEYHNGEAIKFYHLKFPVKPLKESCPCSNCYDGRTYFEDKFDSILKR